MKEFNYEIVKNPEKFQENRMKAHSDHIYYASAEAMEQKRCDFRHSLNGFWKFSYARNYQESIRDYMSPKYNCKNWSDITVPAHIQLEGYDIPQYVNIQYPWDGTEDIEPGEIPTEFNPTACYVKYFYVPQHMKNQRLYISFQGVESGMALWINGAYIGYSEDSFTPSEFELTPYLVEGENKLAVTVFKWTAGSWCEDQDFFRFSGIFRDVYLFTKPEYHVEDLKIQTLLDEKYTNVTLVLDIHNSKAAISNITLLLGEQVVLERRVSLQEHQVLSYEIKQPLLWSAENPVLYELRMELLDESGTTSEIVSQKIGFRQFELKDSVMCLNGKRIVFKGVDRHEFSAVNGRRVSEEEIRMDLITMKQNNINAIRTSHYPNSSIFYSLCDEYGIYVIDETNLETHGIWDVIERGLKPIEYALPGNRKEWQTLVLDRAESMYQRDKNHACILIWSCGNESYGGSNIYEMSQYFRQNDPTRLVHYEGVFHDRRYEQTSDMESWMYLPVEDIKAYLANHREKPAISCEYTHAMGNSCGAMFKYTDLTDEEPLYQGGFIWDYIDQSIVKKDRYGNEFMAYGGDFDDRPCDYNFSGNGIAYGDRTPSPKMQSVKYNYQNISIKIADGQAIICNKNLFTNTEAYDCFVTLEKDGELQEKQLLETHVKPLSQMKIELPVVIPSDPGVYALTLSFVLKEDTSWASKGHETAFGQAVYQVENKRQQIEHVQSSKEAARELASQAGKLKIIYGKVNLGIVGENFRVLFSGLHGGLVSYRCGGRELFKTIPKPNFWRTMTDNDAANLLPFRHGDWKLASLYATHKTNGGRGASAPVIVQTDEGIEITFTYHLPTKPVSECSLSYLVFADGTVRVRLTYDPAEDLPSMPEFGVMFKLDADYNQLSWFGLGPEETYWDRTQGAKLGIYKNQVSDNMAKYLVPQECGNKMGVYWAEVTDRYGHGIRFTGDSMNFSALPYTPHEVEEAMHSYELPQVHYTVIRVAAQQMGIAGDDTWGAQTHKEYMIKKNEPMEFEFSFKGI